MRKSELNIIKENREIMYLFDICQIIPSVEWVKCYISMKFHFQVFSIPFFYLNLLHNIIIKVYGNRTYINSG